jgi:hypothetical protein
MYISGIGSVIRKLGLSYMIYADDIQILACAEPSLMLTTIGQVQKCAEAINSYLRTMKLKMNESKSEIVYLGNRKALQKAVLPMEVEICNSTIKVAQVVRDLGFFVDSDLKFSTHVARVCSTSFLYLKVISRMRQYLTEQTAMMLVHSLVMSRINFCASLLHGMNKALMAKLQRIQNSAFRMVVRRGRHESIGEELKRRKCLPIEGLLRYRYLCLAHKVIYSGAPKYLADLLKIYMPSRDLRSTDSHQLVVPRVNLLIGERAYARCVPRLWNSLPEAIRKMEKYQQFSCALLDHLIDN